jgi:hypothetical protein
MNAAGGRSVFPEVLRCIRGDGATVVYPWPSVESVQRTADRAGLNIRVPARNVIADDAEHRRRLEQEYGWRETGEGWICSRHAPESGEVMEHHTVVRDGSHWLCRFCRRTWPFPSPLPDDAGPCVQRAWRVE